MDCGVIGKIVVNFVRNVGVSIIEKGLQLMGFEGRIGVWLMENEEKGYFGLRELCVQRCGKVFWDWLQFEVYSEGKDVRLGSYEEGREFCGLELGIFKLVVGQREQWGQVRRVIYREFGYGWERLRVTERKSRLIQEVREGLQFGFFVCYGGLETQVWGKDIDSGFRFCRVLKESGFSLD